MKLDEIKKLITEMGNSKLDELSLEFPDGVKVSMKKGAQVVAQTAKVETVQVISENLPAEKIEVQEEKNYKEITSPMVGTFYCKSSPDAEPFVKVGDIVKKGQVLCIIEAMKLMNEIEAEIDGEVVEICVNNEDMVDYGKVLFKIK